MQQQPTPLAHYNSSPDIFIPAISGRPYPSTVMNFSSSHQYRNMMENSLRDVVCKFKNYSMLIREKSFYDYLKPEFVQQYGVDKKNKLFVSEIWCATSGICTRAACELSPYMLVVPRLELVEKIIRDYLDWCKLHDLYNSKKYWNDFDIFRVDDSNSGELKSVFKVTCFNLEEGEFVKNISDHGYFEMTFLTNLGHFCQVIEDRNGGKEIVTTAPELFTGLSIGGSFWIGWTSNNLYMLGNNFYVHTENRKFNIPNEIQVIDDVICGWDNVFIVANSRKELFGCGRNYGCYFLPSHKQTPSIVQVPIQSLKHPEESILKIKAADEAAVILLDSGDLIINTYAISRAGGFKLWTRIDSSKTFNTSQDTRIIDIGVGRSTISLLSIDHVLSVYSLALKLEYQSKLHVSISLDYPLFVMNKIVDKNKTIVQESNNPSLLFKPTILHGEESTQVWFHAINPIDLFQSDYRRNMISVTQLSDIQFNL